MLTVSDRLFRRAMAGGIAAVLVLGTAVSRRLAGGEPRLYPAVSGDAAGGPAQYETVMVFVGSSGCTVSNAPELPATLLGIRDSLARRARQRGYRFASVGVAIDVQPDQGLRFLSRFAPFDEVIAGRSWFNTGAVAYLWRDVAGQGEMPQVLVIERRADFLASGHVDVSTDRVIARKRGLPAITRWLADGVPTRESSPAGAAAGVEMAP